MNRRFRGALVMTLAAIGAVSAYGTTFIYTTNLSGPAEDPPNASPGTGNSLVTFDDVAHTLRVQASFQGLTGTTTAAHIHAPTTLAFTGVAGVATQLPTFTGFPSGVTSGTYDVVFNTLAAETYNPAFVTEQGGTAAGAELALFNALDTGKAYFNIHSTEFPGGEIRGFYTLIPEPASWAMMILGFGIAGTALRRRRVRTTLAYN